MPVVMGPRIRGDDGAFVRDAVQIQNFKQPQLRDLAARRASFA
jgi:hypothetical protein